jgi:hypothetical protein
VGSLTAAALSAVLHMVAPHVGQVVNLNYTQVILAEARRRDIDPMLVVALVEHESRWRPGAISPNGEDFGLGQIRGRYERPCLKDFDPIGDPSILCDEARTRLLDGTYNLKRTIAALAENRKLCRRILKQKVSQASLLASYGGMNNPSGQVWCGHKKTGRRWVKLPIHPALKEILDLQSRLHRQLSKLPRPLPRPPRPPLSSTHGATIAHSPPKKSAAASSTKNTFGNLQ